MYNKIIFIGFNNNIGSDKLRVSQIVSFLKSQNVVSFFQYYEKTSIEDKNFLNNIKNYKKSLFIWCWEINLDIIKILDKTNTHVYDIVDNYLFNKQKINTMLNNNEIHGIIVNNLYMRQFFKENTKFIGRIFVIYHNYDPTFESAILTNQENLTFGFMGSIPSLSHTNNFLYYNQLINEFNIEMLNTEDFKYYTNDIKNNSKIIFPWTISDLKNVPIKFNCHISIRPINSDTSKFKTSAKIATAAFFNHNIITTIEEAVKDILPKEYPFILYDDDIETVRNMFNIVIIDYNSDKKLWNKGLEIMKIVKEKLSIEHTKKDYIDMIEQNYELKI